MATTLVACGLIAAASLQCVLFKAAGNMLPREPLFILLVVAGLLLIPTWALIGAIEMFGGVEFVQRTRTLEMRRHFAVIGSMQALSGVKKVAWQLRGKQRKAALNCLKKAQEAGRTEEAAALRRIGEGVQRKKEERRE